MNLHILYASLWNTEGMIDMFPLPVVCGRCGYPVFTAVGPFLFDRPLSAPGPGGGWPPTCPVWPGAGWSRLANGHVSSAWLCLGAD